MSDFDSLIFYICMFFMAILAFSFHKNRNRFIAWICLMIAILIPTLIAGFRYMVGTDYGTYYYMFMSLLSKSYQWILTDVNHLNTERGFLIVSKFAASIFGLKGVFGFYSFVILSIVIATIISQYKNFNITFIFFLFLFGPNLTSYNLLRQSIALAILFWGLKFVFNGSFRRYMIIIICASFFHLSSILAFPIYFLWNHKRENEITTKKKVILYLTAIVLVLAWPSIFMTLETSMEKFFSISITKYTAYVNSVSMHNSNNRSFYLKLFWCVVFILFKTYYKKYDKRLELFINMYTIGVIFEYTGFDLPVIKRIASYYNVYAEIMLITTLPLLFKKNMNSFIIKAGLVFYTFCLFFTVSFSMNQGNYFPYRIQ